MANALICHLAEHDPLILDMAEESINFEELLHHIKVMLELDFEIDTWHRVSSVIKILQQRTSADK